MRGKGKSVAAQDRYLARLRNLIIAELSILGAIFLVPFLLRILSIPLQYCPIWQNKETAYSYIAVFYFVFMFIIFIVAIRFVETQRPSMKGFPSLLIGSSLTLLFQGIIALLITSLMISAKPAYNIEFTWEEINFFKDMGVNFFLTSFGLMVAATQFTPKEEKTQPQKQGEG